MRQRGITRSEELPPQFFLFKNGLKEDRKTVAILVRFGRYLPVPYKTLFIRYLQPRPGPRKPTFHFYCASPSTCIQVVFRYWFLTQFVQKGRISIQKERYLLRKFYGVDKQVQYVGTVPIPVRKMQVYFMVPTVS